MNKIIVFFFSIVFFVSCSLNNETLNGFTNPGVDFDQLEKIDLRHTQPYKAMLFSDLFSSVKYIPLEETNQSVIGDIEKMEMTEKGDILVFDHRSRCVLKFSGEGKFLNTIGQAGHAENEYVEPLYMAYDGQNHQVVVYDNARKCLKYYKEDGEYVESIHLPWYINSFEILDKDKLLLYMQYDEFASPDSIGYNYVVIDKNAKILNKFAPYKKQFFNALSNVFCKDKGHIYCHIPQTPVVNEVNADEMTPIFYIDFGERSIPQGWYKDNQFDQKLQESTNNNYTWGFFKSGNRSVFSFSQKDKDKNPLPTFFTYYNGKDVIYTNVFENDIYGRVSTDISPIFFKGKNVYFKAYPTSFDGYSNISVDVDLSKTMAKEIKQAIAEGKCSEKWTDYLSCLMELYSKPTTKIVVTAEEKEEMQRLAKHRNPIIQVCTLKD